jgi:hypothetical protein
LGEFGRAPSHATSRPDTIDNGISLSWCVSPGRGDFDRASRWSHTATPPFFLPGPHRRRGSGRAVTIQLMESCPLSRRTARAKAGIRPSLEFPGNRRAGRPTGHLRSQFRPPETPRQHPAPRAAACGSTPGHPRGNPARTRINFASLNRSRSSRAAVRKSRDPNGFGAAHRRIDARTCQYMAGRCVWATSAAGGAGRPGPAAAQLLRYEGIGLCMTW